MSKTRAFWLDREYDREHSDDGASRYAAYVRQGKFEPWTEHAQAVELAVFAWRRATGPVMMPGYVRRHPRILSAQLERSDWDGSLIAEVDVLTSAPPGLRGAPLPADGYWRDWPTEWTFSADRDVFYEPGSEDVAGGSYMLASVSLRFTVPGDLPEPGPEGAEPGICVEAVEILAGELNAIVGPVLARIEGN